ncbi:glycosyltransferase [Streptomyces sp. BI20]|uniref:glycosyltransferase n=1 Tax=Streptomyces sp. BI20 TaxID=3403460 RepID=UPI003C74B5E5
MTTPRHSPAPWGDPQAAAPAFPRHIVTTVLVAHDGARWLPETLAGLLAQHRPPQDVIAADTGSADESATLLAEALGTDRVLHLARRTGFGTAVEEAARTAGRISPEDLPHLASASGWDPVSRTWREAPEDQADGEPVHWLWLLHDDGAPAPDALAELLRVADAHPDAAVVGPKLRGWYDTRQLLEVGVTLARGGRRWTGLDRREQDQGQHDTVRPVLAVSTAGMLLRRDVHEALGGFDRRLPLMRDDVDLCWRANTAGHTVLVAPDAVLRHAEAATRERRPVDCAGRVIRTPGRDAAPGPRRVDKAAAAHTLLANSTPHALPYTTLRLILGTLLRTLAHLLAKDPRQAWDESAGLLAVLLRPDRIRAARAGRPRPARTPADLRPLFPPPGAGTRAALDRLAGRLGRTPADPDAPTTDTPGRLARLRRLVHNPLPLLLGTLGLLALLACRHLLLGGPPGGLLSGGALLPAPDTTAELRRVLTDTWHPVGAGTTADGPPWAALLALAAALLPGTPDLALTLLFTAAVPLAALSAHTAARPLIASRPLRAGAAAAYALLPATTGALADGRVGTVLLAVLLPWLLRTGLTAHHAHPAPTSARTTPAGRPRARRTPADPARRTALWAHLALLTLTTAFTPIVWPLAVALALAALIRRRDRAALPGLLLTALLPLLALAPWSLGPLTHPARLLGEAGLALPAHPGPALTTTLDLLTLGTGDPTAPGRFLTTGLLLAALAATLRTDRRPAITAAWTCALIGLLGTALTQTQTRPGPTALLYGLGLLTAAALGADGAAARLAAHGFGWRQPTAAALAVLAAAGPLALAALWLWHGADGPLARRDPAQVPAFVAEESQTRDRPRTLVLAGDPDTPGGIRHALVRGAGAHLGDADLTALSGPDPRLDATVSALVAGTGADQSDRLGALAVRHVLVRDSAPAELRRVLDTTPGLSRLSRTGGSSLWRVDRPVARAVILPGTPGEAPVPVAAGPVEIHTDLPAGEPGRRLRLAETPDPGWHATLAGAPLTPRTLDDGSLGFDLPPTGGRLHLTHPTPPADTARLWAQAALVPVLLVLALPARRRRLDDDLPEDGLPAVPGQAGPGRHRHTGPTTPTAPADPHAADPYAADPYAADPYAADPYAATAHTPEAHDPTAPYEDPAWAHAPYDPAHDSAYEPGRTTTDPHPSYDSYGRAIPTRPHRDGTPHP